MRGATHSQLEVLAQADCIVLRPQAQSANPGDGSLTMGLLALHDFNVSGGTWFIRTSMAVMPHKVAQSSLRLPLHVDPSRPELYVASPYVSRVHVLAAIVACFGQRSTHAQHEPGVVGFHSQY